MRCIILLATGIAMLGASCQKISDQGKKKGEKVLRLNISREPPTLDPRKVFDPAHQAVIGMLFEGLTKLESDLTVSLAQADAIEVSTDRCLYTIRIGPHSWSNGKPVTAFDFEKTFLTILDPSFPSPHAHLLYDVKGAQEAKKGNSDLKEVSIHALDAEILEIKLEHPNPSFLQILASPALVPVYRLAEEKWAESNEALFICNGPFVPSIWNHHMELLIKKNPHYRGKTRAKLDAIHISMIDNETTALHMYATGHLDILGTPFSQIPLPYLNELKEQGSLTVNPVAASLFCGFNTKAFPFTNKSLRKAFSTAIHRRELVEHITLLDEELGLSAIPSILKPQGGKQWIQDGDDLLARRYLEEGLQELGVTLKDLENLTLHYWPFELNYRIAQMVQQQWLQTLGIKVRIEVIDFKTLLSKVEAGTYQFALFAWTADYADPLSLLDRFRLASDSKNYPHWESSQFTSYLDASSEEPDPDKRLELLEKAEQLLMEEMPLAPLFHWNFSLLIQPKVKGFNMDPLGNIRFEQISI